MKISFQVHKESLGQKEEEEEAKDMLVFKFGSELSQQALSLFDT